MAGYEWRQNRACKATYAILTHPGFKQFRADSVSFEQAGGRTMGSLPIFNHSASPALRKDLARLWAQEFLLYLAEIHPLTPEDQNVTTDEVYNALAEVLSSKEKTVADLAGAVDAAIKFPDEE